MTVWANAIGYQLVWFVAVWGAAAGYWWLAPLALVVARLAVPIVREAPEHVPPHGGAPPPSQPWRRLPPTVAPPSAT